MELVNRARTAYFSAARMKPAAVPWRMFQTVGDARSFDGNTGGTRFIFPGRWITRW